MLTEGKIFGNIVFAVSKLEMQKTLLISVWRCSLVGQSVRFIPGRSVVRLHSPLPFFFRVIWEFSSAGRASALQAEGHRFEPCNSHHLRPGSSVGQNASLSRWRSTVRARSRSPFFYNFIVGFIAQLVEQGTENPRVSGSIPLEATNSLWWMQRSWLERQFVALEVVSSNLIFHPIIFHQFYIHWTVAKR